MWKATFTSLWSRKLRMTMSLVAIILGVAFVSGSFVFSDMIMNSFKGITSSGIADVNVSKDTTVAVDDGRADSSKIDDALIEKIRQVDGVDQAGGVVGGPGIIVINNMGKALVSIGPPQLGYNWFSLPALGGLPGGNLLSGHEPQADDQILLDPDTLRKSGYQVGDTLKVITPTLGTLEFTVVGTATFGNGSTAGASYAFLSEPMAQKIFLGGSDRFSAVWVTTHPDADRGEVSAAVQQVLPEGYSARDGQLVADELNTSIGQAMGFVDLFLLVFAGIALLVASFLIVNTFTILVAQRSKELALFRAMGASKPQILGTVVAEALVLGVVGSVIGLFGGVGLAYGLREGMKVMWDIGPVQAELSTTAVLVSLFTGIIVTLLASLGPARRAARIAPVEAMSTAQTEPEKGLGARAAIGVTMAMLGAVAILAGLFLDVPQPLGFAGAGMALALVGVAIASPLLGRPVVWLAGRIYRSVFGEVGKLAELNSLRQPRRTAATASALMIGLTLVSMIAIIGQSANRSITEQVENTVRGDYMVGQVGFMEFPSKVTADIAAVESVQEVHPIQMGVFFDVPEGQQIPSPEVINDVSGQYWNTVGGMQANSLDKAFSQQITQGRMFSGPNEMIVEADEAAKQGWGLGSTTRLYSPEAQRTVTFTVVGLYSNGDGISLFDKWVSTDSLQSMGLAKKDVYLSIFLKPGVDRAAARADLDAAVADMPLVSVMDMDEYTDMMLASLAQTMALLYGLLGLSIVIAVLGIINTLGLSISERTREIGLLRAIALTRAQVRRMISLESVVIALLGAVVGIGLGIAFGIVLQRVMPEEQGITTLSIPWDQLAMFLVAAGVVGVLAAVWPAHRAARTNVLEAIAAE